MKRVSLFILLILAFVSFSTFSFADSSPPGVGISIDYELSGNIDVLSIESVITDEGRVTVYDCDLKFWPVNSIAINILKTNSFYSLGNYKSMNKAENRERGLTILEQFTKPVNKHGITDKEAGFRQNIHSYLL